jgi:predicted  nucleic acid-binding Zn-ribbon protein
MNIIEYIRNKKSILEDLKEMDRIDRDYDILRTKYAKQKAELESLEKEIEILNSRNTKHLKTIRELRKELKGLKNDKEIH